jgi:threonine aldolase
VSGTMGNLLALLAQCRRGEEAILGDNSHIYNYEAGGASALGGIVFHPVSTGRFGELPLAELQHAIRPAASNIHYAPPGVICVESTHNRCGGTILSQAYLREVRAIADHAGVPVHLDGSRIFNAAVALPCDVREFTKSVDSVQFCLSKGLSAPVGSLVCGPKDFIAKARRLRKMVGGGMRQAGIIAAAGIVALTEMVDRLAEDHHTARQLADGLVDLPGMTLDLDTVQTNIVIFGPQKLQHEGPSFAQRLASEGVKVGDIDDGRFRAVTHYGITNKEIDEAVKIVRRVWKKTGYRL